MTLAEKYRIIQRLGNQQKRKFSEVFLVENKQTGERGTLKVLARTTQNEILQQRLRQEATFDFQHPGLPQTCDWFESDTELLLVRSYAEGIPLQDFIKTIRQKDKPAFLLQLLKGLEPLFSELKTQNVVHLDIKPSNIILSGTLADLHVALIDFGMALRTDQQEQRSTLFPLGYAAPELLLNRLHLVDHRTDFFALGVVLWQLFTGKLPLLHPNPSITTNLQLTHPLPAHDLLPKPFFPILERMCAKHSFGLPPNQLPESEMDTFLRQAIERRYPDLSEVITDWETALQAKKRFLFWG